MAGLICIMEGMIGIIVDIACIISVIPYMLGSLLVVGRTVTDIDQLSHMLCSAHGRTGFSNQLLP